MGVIVGLAAALLVYNGVAFNLAFHGDDDKPRDSATDIFLGAEPRELGPENSPCAALFIHGFGGAGTDFADLPDRMAEKGWRVRIMLLPGHGTHPREMAKQTPESLLEAVRAEVKTLREHHDKVILISHSMGGALSTIVASEMPVDGLVLGAPYFRVTYRWYYVLPPEIWGRITGPFIRWVYKGKLFMQVNREEAKEHIISYTWLPSSAVRTLTKLGKRARAPETLGKVNCPVLILHGRDDIAASPEAAQKALEAIASRDKRFVLLDRSNHHMYWDYDQEQVFEETLAFADKVCVTPAGKGW
jgi:carboxylesterase